MKGIFLFFTLVLLLTFGACSATEDGATAVGQKFQDGIQGRGQIVPDHATSDSFGPDYR